MGDYGQYTLVHLCCSFLSLLFSYATPLLQHMTFPWAEALQKLLQCRSSSQAKDLQEKMDSCVGHPRTRVPVRRTCSCMGSSTGCSSFRKYQPVQHGVLQLLQCRYLPHCGLFYKVQGNTCSNTCSTPSLLF